MAHPTRILYVAAEVAPFAAVTETAQLVRVLPEQLQENGDFDTRIMMPRYGTISERKNRLHEVIRLSGTEIPMGDDSETLKVKVASIPGARLQVYFMDNAQFFKRKGLHSDKKGDLFEDNAERALFFGRSVLETLRKLRWGPDVIHAIGWVSGLIPLLLRTEYKDEELFAETKAVYTPDGIDVSAAITSDFVDTMNLPINGEATGLDIGEVGLKFADMAAFPPSLDASAPDLLQFSNEVEEMREQALSLYDQVLNGVPA